MKAMKSALIATSVGALLAVLGASAAAADPINFTWTPSAVGLAGGAIVGANNFNVTDYATITVTNGLGDFTESGALNVSGFLNGGSPVTASGLDTTGGYSLYYVFTGTGNQGGPTPTVVGTSVTGNYSSLSYTLYASTSAHPTFTVGAGGVVVAAPGSFALATGSLVGTIGNTVTLTDTRAGLSPSADIEVTLDPCLTAGGACTGDESAFFTSPAATTTVFQFGDFGATGTVTSLHGNQVWINGGGGNITEATVPEPFTLSLFGAGLVGAAALRRRKKAKA